MKIQTAKINEALSRMIPIAPRRTSLPILSTVRIEADGKILRLTASNLDEFCEESIDCDGKIEATCVSLQQFACSLGGDEVEIESGSNCLKISFSGGEVELAIHQPAEFPATPKLEKSQKHGIACQEAAKAISSVVWSVCDQPERYNITAAHIESSDKSLAAIGTDGRWMAVYETAAIGCSMSLNIPKDFCPRLSAALERDGAVLSSNENWARVDHNSGYYLCKQNEAQFPDWKLAFPKENHLLGSLNIEEARRVSSFCNGFNDKMDKPVILTFSKSGLRLDFIGANNAKAHRGIGGEFKDFTIAVSLIRLKDIFSNLSGETAKIYHSGDELSPLVIESGDVSVVLTPMRIT